LQHHQRVLAQVRHHLLLKLTRFDFYLYQKS
jgi:hypothetical protein